MRLQLPTDSSPQRLTSTEDNVAAFWQTHPCGENVLGERFSHDHQEFFRRYDELRYSRERHILGCLDAIDFRGKHVLEIGLGQGADSEQIIRRGARWTGIDLTPASVQRVRARLELRGLPYESIMQSSALAMPFPDGSFDIVFSHGVLHHIPDIKRAQSEIRRVLKPGGELIAMLYARWSLNYLVSIHIVRRLALALCYALNVAPNSLVEAHIGHARAAGLLDYLRMQNFIHRNTDGPDNVFSRVYDLRLVRRHFPDFAVTRSYRRYMHAPPLPVAWLPLERQLGWHLWVHMRPKPTGAKGAG
jgi:SAM-dependent methyltransferase